MSAISRLEKTEKTMKRGARMIVFEYVFNKVVIIWVEFTMASYLSRTIKEID